MFPPACGPLSSAVWPQVVRVLLGLIHGVSQMHTLDTAQLALGAERHLQEQLRLRALK